MDRVAHDRTMEGARTEVKLLEGRNVEDIVDLPVSTEHSH